ncbi:MAG: ATP-binding protein [Pseudomonadota bacterium]
MLIPRVRNFLQYVELHKQLQVAVHNEGAVPVEIRDSFFNKFVTHGKQGGTGLGTYSARMLAGAQNGIVALDVSDPGATTITVTLPAAP